MYTIKNYKTFKGHEGEPCAQGTLHGPKGKAAEWSDDSWGGPMRVHFVSKAAESEFLTYARQFMATRKKYDGSPYIVSEVSDESLIEDAFIELTTDYSQERDAQSAAKKGIAFYRQSPGGARALYSSNAPYTPTNVAELRVKYPDIVEVVNERLGLPFVDEAAYRIAEENKRLRRLCKTLILFTLPQPGAAPRMMQRKQPYSAAAAAALRDKYPDLLEIVNERFL